MLGKKYIYSLLFVLGFGVPGALGQAFVGSEPLAEEVEPLSWPEAGRPEVSISINRRVADGYEESVLHFEIGGGPVIVAERHGSWAKAPTLPRYSLQLRETRIPELDFGISIFGAEEFMTSLDREDWDRYLAYLGDPASGRKIVFEHSNQESSGGPFVFGKAYRQVAYEWNSPQGEPRKAREIFVFLGDQLCVFSFRGLPDSVDRTWRRQEMMLGRMNLL